MLIAIDLAPADTALLSKDAVAAFVTEGGGPTSHTAILSRAMGVPAVVACPGATDIPPGIRVLVDGNTGRSTAGAHRGRRRPACRRDTMPDGDG